MAFIRFNANPSDKDTIDCVIRGISVLLDLTWNQVHDLLTEKAGKEHEVYLRNDFWIELLMSMGYKLYFIPDTCPYCITVERFAEDHPEGRYLLGTGSHVIACINGDYIDTWNSGRELPIYYLAKESCYD